MPLDQDETPLFGGFDPPETSEVDPKLSAGQRLTLRQAENIAVGIHPLTRGRLHSLASRERDASAPKNDPFTCGSCYFRTTLPYHNRTYTKCLFDPRRSADDNLDRYQFVSHGPATDVRAWWPACPNYSPSDSISPDAARSIPEAI